MAAFPFYKMPDSQTINIDGVGPVLFEKSTRTRRIIISVRPPRRIRVAIPFRQPLEKALEFVCLKKTWIQKNLAKITEAEKRSQTLTEKSAHIDKTAAKNKLESRLSALAEKHGFRYNKVCIRNQKTRWGSCSQKNNISLNIKLMLLPAELADYVLLHELVHTRVHNHSRNFWAELDKYTGNAKALNKKLKHYDLRLI